VTARTSACFTLAPSEQRACLSLAHLCDFLSPTGLFFVTVCDALQQASHHVAVAGPRPINCAALRCAGLPSLQSLSLTSCCVTLRTHGPGWHRLRQLRELELRGSPTVSYMTARRERELYGSAAASYLSGQTSGKNAE